MISEEQKQNRIGKIGSSDVPSLLGISPYGNKSKAKQLRDCYFNVLGLSNRKESSSMRDGTFLEPAILNWAEWKLGKGFLRDQQSVHPQHDWLIASFDGYAPRYFSRSIPDGVCSIREEHPFVVEVKWVENPEFQSHWGRSGCKKPENIPPYVLAQVMHQLHVAGPEFEIAHVACLRAANGFGLYTIPRDNELIGLIFEEEKRFYMDHLKPRIAPELPEGEQQESECAA